MLLRSSLVLVGLAARTWLAAAGEASGGIEQNGSGGVLDAIEAPPEMVALAEELDADSNAKMVPRSLDGRKLARSSQDEAVITVPVEILDVYSQSDRDSGIYYTASSEQSPKPREAQKRARI